MLTLLHKSHSGGSRSVLVSPVLCITYPGLSECYCCVIGRTAGEDSRNWLGCVRGKQSLGPSLQLPLATIPFLVLHTLQDGVPKSNTFKEHMDLNA